MCKNVKCKNEVIFDNLWVVIGENINHGWTF